jgi:hypothetical protein
MVPLAELYETDFYAWTRYQARELKRLRGSRLNAEIDLGHLIEEVWGLGDSKRDACRSQARRVLEHLLKLRYSPSARPRTGWKLSVVEARSALDNQLSKALERDLQRHLGKLYVQARRAAVLGLEKHAETQAARLLPRECPFTIDDVLRDDWYPEPVVRVE